MLEVFERLPVLDDLVCKPILDRDGGNRNIGNVLSRRLITVKTVKLRKKEGSSLLLLRYTVLRIAPRTGPHPRLSWGRCTVLAVVVGWKAFVDVTEAQAGARTMRMSP